MKSVLISTVLVATSFAASAMNYGIDIHTDRSTNSAKTRAEVLAEVQLARAAGQINLSESEMRVAERAHLQAQSSTLTRQQVQQAAVALRRHSDLGTHGDN